MNTRMFFWCALLACIAAVLWCFLTPDTAPGKALPMPASDLAPASTTQPADTMQRGPLEPTASDRSISKSEWDHLLSLFTPNPQSPPALTTFTTQEASLFLSRRGETAVNLVTAFRWSKDRRFLDRALELFPENPLVLSAALGAIPGRPAKTGEKFGPDLDRLALIERLKAADPGNPLPWIHSAAELFKSGPCPEALADLEAALDRPAFYTYASEQADAAAMLFEDTRTHPDIAALLSLIGLPLDYIEPTNQTARMLMEQHRKASETGDTQTAARALRAVYELGRLLDTPDSKRFLVGQLVGNSVESKALKALENGTQPAWLSVDPARRLAEIDNQKKAINEATVLWQTLIQRRDQALLAEYARKLRFESETEALAWLKSQIR